MDNKYLSPKTVLVTNLILSQLFFVGLTGFYLRLSHIRLWNLDEAFLSGIIVFTALVTIVVSLILIRELYRLIQKEQDASINEFLLKQSRETVDLLRMQRHDFVNHLQVIYGMHQLKKTDKVMEYIREISGEMTSVTRVNEIRNPVIAALLTQKCLEAELAGVRLYIHTQSELEGIPLTFSKVSSILGNLLDNAIQAARCSCKGTAIIELEIFEDESIFKISVHNTGEPIPDNLKHRIFEIGFSTKGEDGHGFGLYIVKRLVESCRGTVQVTSSDSDGTTFMISIPKKA